MPWSRVGSDKLGSLGSAEFSGTSFDELFQVKDLSMALGI
jgi:hypothetical protein